MSAALSAALARLQRLADDPHLQLIARSYAGRRARRSQRPLLAHVEEGLLILAAEGAGLRVWRAFCLHPLLQSDEDLRAACAPGGALSEPRLDPLAVALAMEYRAVANAALSTRELAGPEDIALGSLAEVAQMLVADKVQNRRDFERFHADTHPRAAALRRYFALWLSRLGVDEARYERLHGLCEAFEERGEGLFGAPGEAEELT